MTEHEATENQMPVPDPALRQTGPVRRDLVHGGEPRRRRREEPRREHHVRVIPGGFFLKQHANIDFAGFAQIDSTETIGYDPETGTFQWTVYSNMSPAPLPYT